MHNVSHFSFSIQDSAMAESLWEVLRQTGLTSLAPVLVKHGALTIPHIRDSASTLLAGGIQQWQLESILTFREVEKSLPSRRGVDLTFQSDTLAREPASLRPWMLGNPTSGRGVWHSWMRTFWPGPAIHHRMLDFAPTCAFATSGK